MLRTLALASLCLALTGSAYAAAPRSIVDIQYIADGLDKHRLDLYLPASPAGAPVVVFVHGGAFMLGDRRGFASVGRDLAGQGIAVVIPSYRLFPDSDAQGATNDVAAAVAWTIKNAATYDLDTSRLYLAGHSAGAQIVSMLGTHPKYLRQVGVDFSHIRGVISLAGVYDVRNLSDEPQSWQVVDFKIYGQTSDARARISPALDIDPHAPPFMIVCGSEDDPDACVRATYFMRHLHAAGVSAFVIRDMGADHMGVLRSAIDPRDPVFTALTHFIGLATKGTPRNMSPCFLH